MWHNISLNVSFIITKGDYTEYDSKQCLTFFLKLCLAFRLVVPCSHKICYFCQGLLQPEMHYQVVMSQ